MCVFLLTCPPRNPCASHVCFTLFNVCAASSLRSLAIRWGGGPLGSDDEVVRFVASTTYRWVPSLAATYYILVLNKGILIAILFIQVRTTDGSGKQQDITLYKSEERREIKLPCKKRRRMGRTYLRELVRNVPGR